MIGMGYLLSVFLLLLPGVARAHSPVDSLTGHLAEAVGEERVDLLNQLAYEVRGEPERSARYSLEALALANSLGYPRGTAAASYHLGLTHVRRGNYRTAEDFYLQALNSSRAVWRSAAR